MPEEDDHAPILHLPDDPCVDSYAYAYVGDDEDIEAYHAAGFYGEDARQLGGAYAEIGAND